MTDNFVYLQPAYILAQRKYRETSLIIDVLTRDFGRIALLAKGVRKAKSKTAGLLQTFIPLEVSYFGKSDLKTLSHVEISGGHDGLQGIALYCGFYVNELITCFLHKYDPHPEVFDCYKACIAKLLETAIIEETLRIFELDLMTACGYGLILDYDANNTPIKPELTYHFDLEQGAIPAIDGQFSGKTLIALNDKQLIDAKTLLEAKLLMRKVIATYLNGKPLKSRAVINQIMQHLEK